ncbi:MAG: 2,3-diphosphoglycerate synthetase [Theionarchaea archaeon]|nr:2,3-diphosphoglycerate synthetase [Theionarchaea archaeon]MBU6999742.1 2,3-diphosphoglycerate synthetase [Theionarchaea archaeon]MBU7020163.1 2,3-diphosphoglycerate synthetase [Theionarchaea archaeon]MBU7033720.1 2,3-diphosphoglycerate synthetase [Theionarchaea archaeon]MBU7039969.1 2,3-diphosphoglycerate synthetase [Theionarchaea archaeon]
MKILALIDGEHYPPVTEDALKAVEGDVVAAVFLGGTEKIGSIEELTTRLDIPVYEGEESRDILDVIAEACSTHEIEQVIDLSDEPVLTYVSRLRLACTLMREGVQYRGSDFLFTPPHYPRILRQPSLSVVGTAKRVGKTAFSGYVARTLRTSGYTPCIVTMGRGGPAQPEIIRGDTIQLTPSYLMEQANRGKHAASDHWENALISRVMTVGCRRCGGGMAGVPFSSNVEEGARLANTLAATFVILEGSGITFPPVDTNRCIVIVGAHQPLEFINEYFGPFRILMADLLILMMCEEPMASQQKVAEIQKAIDEIKPGLPQAHCVFRPVPLADVSDRKIFLATTAPPAILESTLVPYLEQNYHCDIVKASPHLSNRPRLRKDLEQFLPQVDTLLTEIKASAIDVATREALALHRDVVFMDNVPKVVGGTVTCLEDAIIQLAKEAEEEVA